jgi:hypothetical protein
MSNSVNSPAQRAVNQFLNNTSSNFAKQAEKARELADKFNRSQIKDGKQKIGEYVTAKTPDDTKVKGKYAAAKSEPIGFKDKLGEIEKTLSVKNETECRTCENRKYVDVSDDNSVSFQIPTKISKSEAAAKVRAHENEHVFHEKAKAAEEGKRIVSQKVEIKTAVCPECGDTYVSGGETTTVTAKKPNVNNDDGEKKKENSSPMENSAENPVEEVDGEPAPMEDSDEIPVDEVDSEPAPMEKSAVNPAPVETPAVNPAPMENSVANPAPVDEVDGKPAPAETPAVNPAPVETPAVNPAPAETPVANPAVNPVENPISNT